MNLKKINSADLIFTNEIEDDKTNTYVKLTDYDWMDYSLTTRFKTEELGVLNVEFKYIGMITSTMEVEQTLDGTVEKATYEYSTDILGLSSKVCKFFLHLFPQLSAV